MKKTILLLFATAFLFSSARAQLTVNTAMTPAQLVQGVLADGGSNISNVTFSGITGAIGSFVSGPGSTNLGMSAGVIISTGMVNGTPAIGSPVSNFSSNSNGTGSDPQLASLIPGYTINDAAVLEFDVLAMTDTIKLRYVFASEEYPEWVGSSFNDVFGFFITGVNPAGLNYNNQNIALIPGTNIPVSIDNINASSNAIYYVDNDGQNGQTIVFDGFTTVLTAWCLVLPNTVYHVKLAIGDAGDSAYDSAVFLEAHSLFTGDTTCVFPVLSNYTAQQAACYQGNAAFSLTVSSPSPIYYQWQVSTNNGAAWTNISSPDTLPTYSGYTSSQLTLTNITYASNGNLYRCAISNNLCYYPLISPNALLTVTFAPPVAYPISGPATVCQGKEYTYLVPYSTYTTGYDWTLPNSAFGSSSDDSIQVYFSYSATSGDLIAYGVNGCGNGPPDTLHITVNPAPPFPVITQNGLFLTSSSATGNQWYLNGTALPGDTFQTLYMTSAGDYRLEVTNNFGCSSMSGIVHWSDVAEIHAGHELRIYPNPAADRVIIDYSGTSEIECSLYSIEGKLLLIEMLQPGTNEISVADLIRGIYILRLQGKDISIVQKLLKE